MWLESLLRAVRLPHSDVFPIEGHNHTTGTYPPRPFVVKYQPVDPHYPLSEGTPAKICLSSMTRLVFRISLTVFGKACAESQCIYFAACL